jgi:plasmid stabilization system protein ParE
MAVQYQVVISPRAFAEIEHQCSYYEPIAPDYADRLYRNLIRRIRGLRDMPHVHRVHQHRRDPKLTVHAMSVNPYIIYYRISDDEMLVNVLRVLHGSQRQPRRFP